MSENSLNKIDFEKLLQETAKLPLVHIDRKEFLESELKKYCDAETIELAIEKNPAYAKIPKETINKIADSCINYETIKVSALSFASGIPGGFTLVATIPADIVNYYAHVMRIIQKLAYLYGWQSLIEDEGQIDDETSQILTLFTGVMFGVKGATSVVTKMSALMAKNVEKKIAEKALTKGVIYPIVKKVSAVLGVKMTKEIFAKGVSKVIPVIGGIVSGGITFASYMPMSFAFKDYLAGLDLANPDYYERENDNSEKIIDVDFSDVEIKDIDFLDEEKDDTGISDDFNNEKAELEELGENN